MGSFGPGLSEASRFITEVLQNDSRFNPDYIVLDANSCYSWRSYPRIVSIFGEEHVGIAGLKYAPFALMVFKKIRPPVRITAYEGKKVDDKELLIDDNGYMWRTHNSWRVAEYENCGECGACQHKGKFFAVDEDGEVHIYNLTRAVDEIRETAPCACRTDGYSVRLFKHFKNVLDKAFVVAQFGAMDRIKFELKLPLGKFSLVDGVLSCSSMPPGLEYVSYFCSAVTAIIKEEDVISCNTDSTEALLFNKMFALAAELGSEDAYSIMLGENVGLLRWSTESISDENACNLSVLPDDPRVQALDIDWDTVNTAEIRRDHVDTLHWAGRLDGTPVSISDSTRYGEIRRPPMNEGRLQLEYLRLDGPNEEEVKTRDGKRALLVVNASGALVATTRRRSRWGRFLKVVRGIGVSPVSLQFDFSSLGEEDACHTTLATKILRGHYGDKALRFLLEMAHKGRLHVSEHSPNRCFVPRSCLKPHGVVLGVAMPARAFKELVFCCRESDGKADRRHIYWKPTKDGNLFRLDSVAMNLVHMKETESRVDGLKVCTMMLRRDVG